MNNRNLPENTQITSDNQVAQNNLPFKVFNTKEEWQSEINRIISNRLKDYNELKNKVTELEGVIARLAEELEKTSATSAFTQTDWENDFARINSDYPEIDLEALLNDTHFVALITNGTPCIDAFKAVVCDDLIENAIKSERESIFANIKAKASRPIELGLSPRNAFGVNPSPRALSSKQIKEIGERVMRGERIVL